MSFALCSLQARSPLVTMDCQLLVKELTLIQAVTVMLPGRRVEEFTGRIVHASSKIKEGALINSGGRVLNVVGLGRNLPAARARAYEAAAAIRFDGAFYRGDIAWRGMEALGEPMPSR